MWNYLYAQWLEEREEEIKIMRSFGCFVGAFFNPEAARSIQNKDNEESNVKLSEDEFDAASDYVIKSNLGRPLVEKTKKKKRRLKLK